MKMEFADNTSITKVEFDDNNSFNDVKYITESSNVEFNEGTSILDLEFGTVYQVSEEYETYILETPDGTEIPAIFVENEMIFDATEDDIRIGKVAATDSGVTIGEKEIPSYKTSEGFKTILVGKPMFLKFAEKELYDYTKFQAIICPLNTSPTNSVGAEKVVINDNVYEVRDTKSISILVKNNIDQTIEFGINNDGNKPCLIRYFTYKEI